MQVLPAKTSLHRIIVALASIGWYTEIRMDTNADGERSIGVWVSTPYWHGVPTNAIVSVVGWFNADSIESARLRMLKLYERAIQLKSEFPNSVPHYNSATKQFEEDTISSKYFLPYLNDCARGKRKLFTPAPQNLPKNLEEWICNSPDGNCEENILHYLMQRDNTPKDDNFVPFNMFSLKFYAMSSYGIAEREIWYWDSSIYSHRMTKDGQTFRMLPGIRDNHVEMIAKTNDFAEAINVVERSVDRAYEILKNAETYAKVERR